MPETAHEEAVEQGVAKNDTSKTWRKPVLGLPWSARFLCSLKSLGERRKSGATDLVRQQQAWKNKRLGSWWSMMRTASENCWESS